MAVKKSGKLSPNQFGSSEGRPRTAAFAKRAAKEPVVVAKATKDTRRGIRTDNPAVVDLSRALEVFHRQQWGKAAEQLREILKTHAKDNIVVLDRVRTYLRISERNLAPKTKLPQGAEECYQFGILCLNAANLDEAVDHFKRALDADSKSDRARYGLSATLALKDETAPAIEQLRQAIALNPDNRALAANDSDFESLRDEPDFIELVGTGRRAHAPALPVEAGDESE